MTDTSRAPLRHQHAPRRRKMGVRELSHDMKTPLGAIRLYNGLLSEMQPDDPNRRAFHRIIEEQVTRLARLASEHLNSDHQKAPFRLRDLLTDTLAMYRQIHADKGFRFALETRSTLPTVKADLHAVGRVLNNLLDNAVKYGAPHTIRIRALEALCHLTPFAVLEVIDRGQGIDRKDHDRIFDAHFRTMPTGPIPGSGLGLSIARDIVELNGGRIEVDSMPGEGSVFRVFLPAKPCSHTPTQPLSRHALTH